MIFQNRVEAGKQLAEALKKYKGEDMVVYGLPRGGVVIAYQIARELNAPLDVVITRKIGHPDNPEYAIAAVSETGEMIYNEREKAVAKGKWFEDAVEAEQKEAERRKIFLKGLKPIDPQDKIAIVVDDGVATGLTLRLAIKELRNKNPSKIVVAVPVIPKDVAEIIKKEANELVTLILPADYLGSVGAYYHEFDQVEDVEVIRLLRLS